MESNTFSDSRPEYKRFAVFPSMQLPAELCHIVCENYFSEAIYHVPTVYSTSQRRPTSSSLPRKCYSYHSSSDVALLRVCKQINFEAHYVLYAKAKAVVTTHESFDNLKTLNMFLKVLPKRAAMLGSIHNCLCRPDSSCVTKANLAAARSLKDTIVKSMASKLRKCFSSRHTIC